MADTSLIAYNQITFPEEWDTSKSNDEERPGRVKDDLGDAIREERLRKCSRKLGRPDIKRAEQGFPIEYEHSKETNRQRQNRRRTSFLALLMAMDNPQTTPPIYRCIKMLVPREIAMELLRREEMSPQTPFQRGDVEISIDLYQSLQAIVKIRFKTRGGGAAVQESLKFFTTRTATEVSPTRIQVETRIIDSHNALTDIEDHMEWIASSSGSTILMPRSQLPGSSEWIVSLFGQQSQVEAAFSAVVESVQVCPTDKEDRYTPHAHLRYGATNCGVFTPTDRRGLLFPRRTQTKQSHPRTKAPLEEMDLHHERHEGVDRNTNKKFTRADSNDRKEEECIILDTSVRTESGGKQSESIEMPTEHASQDRRSIGATAITSQTEICTECIGEGIMISAVEQVAQVRVVEEYASASDLQRNNQEETAIPRVAMAVEETRRLVYTITDTHSGHWQRTATVIASRTAMGEQVEMDTRCSRAGQATFMSGLSPASTTMLVTDAYIIADSNLGDWHFFSILESDIPQGITVHQPEVLPGGTFTEYKTKIIEKIRSLTPSDCLLIYMGANDSRDKVRFGSPLPLSIYEELVEEAVKRRANVCIATPLPSPCYIKRKKYNAYSHTKRGWCSRTPCFHEKKVAKMQRAMNEKIYQTVNATNSVHYFDVASTFLLKNTWADRQHFVRNDIHLNRRGASLLSKLVASNITLANLWWK